MDSARARDHLDSVATIVRTADRSLNIRPWVFVIWGLYGAILHALQQARVAGVALPADSTIQLPMMVVAIVATVLVSRRPGRRETLIDHHAGVVFSVVLGVLLIASFSAQHRVIPYEGIALFWSFGLAMAALIVGLEASRPLLLGGAVLVVASVAACLVPDWFSGLLAAGWLAGLAAPGFVLAWRGRDG
jgi:hypothetical protein